MKRNNMFKVKIEYEDNTICDAKVVGMKGLDDIITQVKKKIR